MKRNQFKNNITCLFFAALLISTSSFAQFICEMGDRDRFISKIFVVNEYKFTENSGLAYHPKENMLIVVLDAPITNIIQDEDLIKENDGKNHVIRHILGYNFDEEVTFRIPIKNIDSYTSVYRENTDFEGLTHLKGNYFALVEEDQNKIYFLEYLPDEKEIFILSAHSTGIPLVETNDLINGLNGISYDPHTERLYLVNEMDNKLYSIKLKQLPGPDSSGEIEKYEGGSNYDILSNEIIDKPGGIFHLGQIYPANHPLSNNLLIVGRTTPRAILEIEVSLDDDNNLNSESINLIKSVSFHAAAKNEPKPQSVVVVDNKIYVGSDSVVSDGGVSGYIVKSVNNSCEDDGYIYDNNCECVNCPSDLWVNTNAYTNDFSLTDSYESNNSIETVVTNTAETDVLIRKNETVDLKSDHITLNEGFKVESGACLNAEIEPCEE